MIFIFGAEKLTRESDRLFLPARMTTGRIQLPLLLQRRSGSPWLVIDTHTHTHTHTHEGARAGEPVRKAGFKTQYTHSRTVSSKEG